MKKTQNLYLVLCAVFFVSVCAKQADGAYGMSNPSKVVKFWCQGAKSCFVHGDFGNPGKCAVPHQLMIDESTLWQALDSEGKSNGGFNFVMSLVLISQTQGKKFKCWVYGCQSAQGTTFNKCVQPGLE